MKVSVAALAGDISVDECHLPGSGSVCVKSRCAELLSRRILPGLGAKDTSQIEAGAVNFSPLKPMGIFLCLVFIKHQARGGVCRDCLLLLAPI